MMKKILLISVIAAMILTCFSGCGKKDNVDDSDNKLSITDTAEDNKTDDKKEETAEKEDTADDKKDDTNSSASKNENKPNTNQNSNTGGNNTQTSKPEIVPEPEPEQPTATPSAADVMTALAPYGGSNVTEMPSDLYLDVYGIDPTQFDSVSIYGAMMNVKADEIIVIKAKDATGLNRAVAALNNRKTTLMAKWERYLPDQYELVKASKVTTSGNYALYAVGQNADSIISTFLNTVK